MVAALSLPFICELSNAWCAHLGKSTLADRLLELTGTIPSAKNGERNKQVLDTLKVERERGITVRAMSASYARLQAIAETLLIWLARMIYLPAGEDKPYLLNLLDT